LAHGLKFTCLRQATHYHPYGRPKPSPVPCGIIYTGIGNGADTSDWAGCDLNPLQYWRGEKDFKITVNILPELEGSLGDGVVVKDVNDSGSVATLGGSGCEATEGGVTVAGLGIKDSLWLHNSESGLLLLLPASAWQNLELSQG